MSLIIPANTLASGGYAVDNSCRFDGSSSYMHKDIVTPTNQKKYTISAWVKRSKLTSRQRVFTVIDVDSTAAYSYLEFQADDKLNFDDFDGDSTRLTRTTNAQFRDPSAWMNIIIAVDTTIADGSAVDRVKMYINGTQVSSFGTTTNASQNYDTTTLNSNKTFRIGEHGTAGFRLGGYICEFVLIDGLQLDATSFGEFDEDSGIWKPISVSGLTFGNNGFYLDYEDSANLGNDANGGTDLTEVNLAATDQSTDTCTNNFATMNPLDNYLQAHAFSDGNLTVTTTNASQSYSTSSILLTSGKWYVECKPVSGGSEPEIGVANKMVLLNAGNNAQLSYNANGYGYRASDPGTVWYNGEYVTNALVAYANGDIIGIALDLDNNKLYFSKNGTFANSQDPTDGTNAVSIVDPASTEIGGYVFAMNENFNDQNKVFSWNFGYPSYAISSGNTDGNGYGNFEYAPPSGYFACCTKNLAENG